METGAQSLTHSVTRIGHLTGPTIPAKGMMHARTTMKETSLIIQRPVVPLISALPEEMVAGLSQTTIRGLCVPSSTMVLAKTKISRSRSANSLTSSCRMKAIS